MNALQADPADQDARILQARVQLALGDGSGAEAELDRASQSGTPPEQLRHLFAHARLLQGDPQAALRDALGTSHEHRAYGFRIAARAHFQQGDVAAAVTTFEQAMELAPSDSALWTDIGRFRRSNGDRAGAIQAIDRAVTLNPQNVEALVQRGELTRGQYGLAASLPWFDRALETDPGNITALLERAITYGDMGRMRDMLADARQVLALSPNHPTAWYLLSALAARGHDFELARLLYNRTAGAFDSTPAGMLLAGAIDYGTGNDEQAVRRLAMLVEAQPGNRKARRLLAAAQWRAGNFPAVVETLAPIVSRPDSDSYSLALTGQALARLDDHSGAAGFLAKAARPMPPALSAVEAPREGEFERLVAAAEAEPRNGPLQVRLVSALLARGSSEEALRRALIMKRLNPGAPETHLLVGDVLGMSGDFAAAAEHYRGAANLAFDEPTALRLIESLQRSGRMEAADQVLWVFLRQNPNSIAARLQLAGRAVEQGDWEAAISLYESLRRRLGDNDATILNNLALAYSQSGDPQAAIPLARRAWALNRYNPATADTLGWILFSSGADRFEGLVLLSQAVRGVPAESFISRRLAQAPALIEESAGQGPVRRAE
jgi:cellulose synthase operon protein C